MKKNMRTIAVVLALAVMMLAVSGAAVFADDVDYSQWNSKVSLPQDVLNTKYLRAVQQLCNVKAVTGDTDGLYHAERNITRAEFCKIMAVVTGNNDATELAEVAKENYFTDLDGYGWATPYINMLYKRNMIKGVGDGKFAPGQTISNQEMATILIRDKFGTADPYEYPDGYIQYAEMYWHTVLYRADINDWAAPATRGDVALVVSGVIYGVL